MTKKTVDKLLNDAKKLAQEIMDEVSGGEDIQAKMAALKTVGNFYAMVRKLDGADDKEGSAFDAFRDKIAAASAGRAGSGDGNGGANVVKFWPRSNNDDSGSESEYAPEPEDPSE